MWQLPFVVGHAKIYIGDNVNFFGKVDIFSGRLFDEPKLVLGNRVDLGHNVVFLVNKEIVLEDDINVASGVRFMDTDAHPRDAMERIADLPPRPEEVKPVRVGRYAWIGHNSFIMKGVTIGEGAIIGVNSVVVNDIPPYCVAMGNPARVVVKNINQAAAAAPAHQVPQRRTSDRASGQAGVVSIPLLGKGRGFSRAANAPLPGCHPERSVRAFAFPPRFAAGGRAVEGLYPSNNAIVAAKRNLFAPNPP